jgi:multiple sugar transport system permease protein
MAIDSIAKRYRIRRRMLKIILNVILAVGGVGMIYPFIWMIFSSFKPNIEVINFSLRLIPHEWTLRHYRLVFEELSMLRGYINSIIVASIVTSIVVFSSCAAGYLFAKLKFRGRDTLFLYIIASLMIPPQIGVIPLYFLAAKMHVINTYMGLAFPFIMSAFGIFLMRQFITGIPDSLIDAAKVDGASDWRVYISIIIPLCKSAIAVVGILTFIWSWDEFIWPLVITSQNEMKTLPLLLAHFTAAEAQRPGQSLAACTIVIFPVLIVYGFFRRFFVRGLSMTGMKY